MPVLEAPRPMVPDHTHADRPDRSHGMDGTRTFLEIVQANRLAEGRLRGVFHIAIGRRVTALDGTVLATGITWRELAALLKELKYEKEWVRAFGVDPETIAPRDREKFWYHAVAIAKVDSTEARTEAEQLASYLRPLGWIVGPPPTPGKPAVVSSGRTSPSDDSDPLHTKKTPSKPKPKKK